MFGGAFSLNRFSLGRQESDFTVKARFYGSLLAAAGVGKDVPIDIRNHASLTGTLTLTPGEPVKFIGESAINANMDLICKIPIAVTGKDSLAGICSIGKNISPKLTFPTRLEDSLYIGKNMWEKFSFPTEMQGDLWLAKNIPLILFGSEILNALASVYTLDSQTIQISAAIPPGGRLYIDCDHFNVLLNGENILHLHSGEWIWLDRDLIRIVIDSGTGGPLDGNLVITERFL